MHTFKINTYDTSRWGLRFMVGTYQELVKSPTRKASMLTMDWADQDGVETDRQYNRYESKNVLLPVFIKADTETDLILKYNQFVNEVLITGNDVVLDCEFLDRRFVLRYLSTGSTQWHDTVVSFALELIDDYPATITPIP